MITKVEQDYCVQKIVSTGEKVKHYYKDLKISDRFIYLPKHEETGMIEILCLNSGTDLHSQMVTQIFAKVATA